MQNIMKLERVICNRTCINVHTMNKPTIENHLNQTETVSLDFDRYSKMSLNEGKKVGRQKHYLLCISHSLDAGTRLATNFYLALLKKILTSQLNKLQNNMYKYFTFYTR